MTGGLNKHWACLHLCKILSDFINCDNVATVYNNDNKFVVSIAREADKVKEFTIM